MRDLLKSMAYSKAFWTNSPARSIQLPGMFVDHFGLESLQDLVESVYNNPRMWPVFFEALPMVDIEESVMGDFIASLESALDTSLEVSGIDVSRDLKIEPATEEGFREAAEFLSQFFDMLQKSESLRDAFVQAAVESDNSPTRFASVHARVPMPAFAADFQPRLIARKWSHTLNHHHDTWRENLVGMRWTLERVAPDERTRSLAPSGMREFLKVVAGLADAELATPSPDLLARLEPLFTRMSTPHAPSVSSLLPNPLRGDMGIPPTPHADETVSPAPLLLEHAPGVTMPDITAGVPVEAEIKES